MSNNIVVGVFGPPHSGKSVLLTYLYEHFPQKSTAIVRTAPDGEGIYSNNKDQDEIQMMRKKGKFTEEKTRANLNNITKEVANIVLVDTGGVISEENKRIIKECTHAIILSNNIEDKTAWENILKQNNVSIIASLDSTLDGKDEIYTSEENNNTINGRITNLIRGQEKKPSLLLNEIVTKTIQLAKEKSLNNELSRKGEELLNDNSVIDMLAIAKELNINIDDNNKLQWNPEQLPEILDCIQTKIQGKNEAKFFETRANWLVAATTELCKKNNIQNISYYNARENKFDSVNKSETNVIQKSSKVGSGSYLYDVLPNNKLKLLVKQTNDNILMYFDLHTNMKLVPEDIENFELPDINPNKSLYISGKMPTWLLAHITNTYDNKEKSIMQVGNHYIKYASKDEKNLGTIEEQIDDIDLSKMLEEYREYYIEDGKAK